jgi:hypothetical protein
MSQILDYNYKYYHNYLDGASLWLWTVLDVKSTTCESA